MRGWMMMMICRGMLLMLKPRADLRLGLLQEAQRIRIPTWSISYAFPSPSQSQSLADLNTAKPSQAKGFGCTVGR
ncbi:hypothetical protein HanRHA438_Chr09g0430341 [Helianthus annuus]|nr:hypothetical protein HanRHA438_Chr09g0430341 [Helianthus annuus]